MSDQWTIHQCSGCRDSDITPWRCDGCSCDSTAVEVVPLSALVDAQQETDRLKAERDEAVRAHIATSQAAEARIECRMDVEAERDRLAARVAELETGLRDILPLACVIYQPKSLMDLATSSVATSEQRRRDEEAIALAERLLGARVLACDETKETTG